MTKKSKSKSKSNRTNSTIEDIMDVPNMNTFNNNSDEQSIAGYSVAEQSVDSLEFMATLMKENLNASIRDGDGNFRNAEMMDDNRDNGNHRESVNSRNSNNSNSSGSNSSLSSIQRRVKADHVDVPHLDDMYGNNKNTGDAAAGQGSSMRKSDGSMESSLRGSLGSRDGKSSKRKNHSAIIIEDTDYVPSSPKKSPNSRRGPRSRQEEPYDTRKIQQLEMPTLSESNKNQRSTWMFESLWGSTANNLNNFDAHDENDDPEDIGDGMSNHGPVQLMRTLSDRVGLTQSDASAYEANGGGFGGNRRGGSSMGGGVNCRNSCQSYVRSHVKLVMGFLVLCIGVAATMGVLVVMIPLWLRGEERMESAELGGQTSGVIGDGNGETLIGNYGGNFMNGSGEQEQQSTVYGSIVNDGEEPSNISSNGGEEPSNVISNNDNNSSPAENNNLASPPDIVTTSPKFQAPPYNIQQICAQSSISTSQKGYDKCFLACLPSRCCLVPENDPYQVWKETVIPYSTPSQTSLVATSAMSNSEKLNLSIGTMIPSCFHEHRDLCVQYYNQCSILGTPTLLPRKPPSTEDVKSMSESEKLELAEWINHGCTKLRSGDSTGSLGESECELLCHEKECCFANDDEEEDYEERNAMDNTTEEVGGDTDGEGDNTLNANGFIEQNSFEAIATNLPTFSPSVEGSSSYSSEGSLITYTPTPAGSTYTPTPSDTLFNSFLRQRRRLDNSQDQSLEVVHMEIPGDADFVYVANPQEGQHQFMEQDPPLTTDPSSTAASEGAAPVAGDVDIVDPATVPYDPIRGESNKVPKFKVKNCVGDPQVFCMTYAGCAPLFGE